MSECLQNTDHLYENVTPLLHEIRHALAALIDTNTNSTIDLSGLPMSQGERNSLLDYLGEGEVDLTMDLQGKSRIYETRFPGVWVVMHFSGEDETLCFIEITDCPEILRSQKEDMRAARSRLEQELTS